MYCYLYTYITKAKHLHSAICVPRAAFTGTLPRTVQFSRWGTIPVSHGYYTEQN